jgi:RimJ/RimL family protein N-acetyltransferase
MHMEIEDVLLRKLEPKDIEFLYQYRNDWAVARSLAGFSTGYSRRDLEEWMEAHRQRDDEVQFAIALKEDDRCIGHSGLYQVDYRIGRAQLGTLIGDKSYWGKGIGTAVRQAIIDYGFLQLNLQRIDTWSLADTAAIHHINAKLGFKTEGTLRRYAFRDGAHVDVVVMSLLRDEWEAGRSNRARP